MAALHALPEIAGHLPSGGWDVFSADQSGQSREEFAAISSCSR
jgi:hypothetical protein